jgi:predicted lipase
MDPRSTDPLDENISQDVAALATDDKRELPKVEVHAGFLNGAEALVSAVEKHINSQPKCRHVLFTGHSAGGAVASLLFTRFLSVAKKAECNYS